MSENIVPVSGIEQVLIGGDLAKLSPDQRVNYYRAVCDSLGLNALTQPFAYITLNGKLTLYARKDAADQLRQLRGISISKPEIQFQEDWIIVTVEARDASGRSDSDVGAVNKKDMRGDFGNALMKAVTKAKRRVTLSICGLGMLDETEVETIPNVKVEPVDVVHAQHALEAAEPEPSTVHDRWVEDAASLRKFWAWAAQQGLGRDDVHEALEVESLKDYFGSKTQALTAIGEWVNKQTTAEPGPEPAEEF